MVIHLVLWITAWVTGARHVDSFWVTAGRDLASTKLFGKSNARRTFSPKTSQYGK
ncbi:unnamed protein product [Mycetohabitans rhizoxinica HKI 454]|uniref:Uncharacterized protein n=1 Tax=Mycetohabitans rhizoxinica (strain DSM 19002 / CIP 109453 / HKI 454) TaxID=882378 RepID=E5AKG5_MYCRK|nr:unnamed protein product [Mycetohabitans rhizoxinica HKI 454]